MKTIFLILNYKTYSDTICLTDMLLSQELGDRSILIVDNASPNESYIILKDKYEREEKVDVLSLSENLGYAKGNNEGLRFIKKYNPQYVCVVNNDVRFSLDVIKKLERIYPLINNVALLSPVQFLLDNKPAIFNDLRHIPTFGEDFKSVLGFGKCVRHSYMPDCEKIKLQKVEIVPGAFLFIDYLLFESMGFFYEGTFLFCEERFTAKKIKDAGLCSYILLDDYYVHAHSVTINAEKTRRDQMKLLYEGKILYTNCYRSFPLFKIFLLKIAYMLSCFVEVLKNIVRYCSGFFACEHLR